MACMGRAPRQDVECGEIVTRDDHVRFAPTRESSTASLGCLGRTATIDFNRGAGRRSAHLLKSNLNQLSSHEC